MVRAAKKQWWICDALGSLRMLALILLAPVGCVALPMDREYAGPNPVPNEIIEQFAAYGSRGVVFNSEKVLTTEYRYEIHRVKLTPEANVMGSHELMIDYYQLREVDQNGRVTYGTRPRPLIIVLPILGGGNEIANFFAKYFAHHGYATAIVHRQDNYKDVEETMEALNRVFTQIILDHQQAIDWLVQQPGVDPERIGVFGISAGGVKGALVTALDRRIKGAVLCLVGGDLPYVFAYSSEEGIIEKREAIMQREGLTREEFLQALRDEFEHDPLRYAPYMDARRVILVLGVFDTVVPYRTGLALREAMGGPRTYLIPTGHYTALLYVPFVQSVSLRHFRRCLLTE